ncbi:MAG: alpha-amylase family glycosyl hydrolase [Candidatus Hodarchaeales archaeon]
MPGIDESLREKLIKKLTTLYKNKAPDVYSEIEKLITDFIENNDLLIKSSGKERISYRDIILNTYADSIKSNHSSPLKTLGEFSNTYLKDTINGVHILPFFKWDTDRGFSVLDYYNVDPRNGSWEDFTALSSIFSILMVDCVINHASIDNPLVQKALTGDPEYRDFVIEFSDGDKPDREDLLKITRARPTPVLTRYYVLEDENHRKWATFNKITGKMMSDGIVEQKKGWVWTTFSRPISADGTVATRQVDLNFANPRVLIEFIRLILFYISKGTSWIRLDAIGYLWKKIGTTCLHLKETHVMIELLRDIFTSLEPLHIVLIAEVNEPQEKALQYLYNDNREESDMIYLFTHFPLAVHAVLTGTARYYNNWLPSLSSTSGKLFVSVLGTHDGMGMKPIGNWLPDHEKKKMQDLLIREHGALPNYAVIPGGQKIVYELCSTAWNFVNSENSRDSVELQIDRFLAVLALGLIIRGVPSIYINGLLGIPNFKGELDENRTVNRQVLEREILDRELSDKKSLMYSVFNRVQRLLELRSQRSVFDPNGRIDVLSFSDSVVSVLLVSPDEKNRLISLVNVTNAEVISNVTLSEILDPKKREFTDIITETRIFLDRSAENPRIILKPYQTLWIDIT